MKPLHIHLICFSATGTTAKIVEAIAAGAAAEVKTNRNLLRPLDSPIVLPHDEAVVIGIPVFSGRVPETVRGELAKIKGDNTPAILVGVYGNRAYDDALVELAAIVRSNGFCPLTAAAFVAQHSIFPAVGHGRPDPSDLQQAREFGRRSWEFIENGAQGRLHIKGNTPYRAYKRVPLTPKASGRCNGCGICAKECPVQAIDKAAPRRTDKQRCMACAHCIAVCPQQARRFGGLLYLVARHKFVKAYTTRLEPEMFYPGKEDYAGR